MFGTSAINAPREACAAVALERRYPFFLATCLVWRANEEERDLDAKRFHTQAQKPLNIAAACFTAEGV
ncbi:MAG: hypothetical protein ACXV5H_12100 [Halobacteriota archaeon]